MKALRKTLWILLAAVAIGAVVLAVHVHGQRQSSALDGLYARYSQHDGLAVALVRGKGIPADADSIRVDMLMLTATDSAAWQWLRDEFQLPSPLPPVQQLIDQGSDIVSVRQYRPDDSTATGEYIRVASFLRHQISIINAGSRSDIDAVRHHNMEMNINETKELHS